MVKRQYKKAYGAILTVLIIGVFLTLMSISFSMQSQVRLASIDSFYKKSKSLFLAESCAEDIMARSNNNQNIPETITLPNGTCQVIYNSHPVFKVMEITATVDSYTSKIEVSTTLPPGQAKNDKKNSKFGVLYWHQIE